MIVLVPLGIGASPALLGATASGFIWVSVALATLLSLDRLFQADFEDGSLDQIALGGLPLTMAVLAKVLAHWLTSGLPLTLAAPVAALLLQLPPEGYAPLVLSLLAVNARAQPDRGGGRGADRQRPARGLVLSLLVLPLFVPVVIFGAGMTAAAIAGTAWAPALLC